MSDQIDQILSVIPSEDHSKINRYIHMMQNHLPEKRANHTLWVLDTALKLAHKYSANLEVVIPAAIFHDIAKYDRPDTLIDKGVPEHEVQRDLFNRFPSVWHAFVAAPLIKAQ